MSNKICKQPGLVHFLKLTRIKVGELNGLRQDAACEDPMFADDKLTNRESKVTCADCRLLIENKGVE